MTGFVRHSRLGHVSSSSVHRNVHHVGHVSLSLTNQEVLPRFSHLPALVGADTSSFRYHSTSTRSMRLLPLCTLAVKLPIVASYLSRQNSFRRNRPFASTSRSSTVTLPDANVVSPMRVVSSMPPNLSQESLRNKYYLLRHGQSTANIAEIISSSRSLAYTNRHGLTNLGYTQGVDSSNELLDILERAAHDGEEVVFVSSPFARAYQTAQACIDGLANQKDRLKGLRLKVSKKIQIHDNLVERYFGRLDGQALYTYSYVWPLDKFNVTHTAFDVESVAAVCHRLHSAIGDLEAKYDNCHLVLVSHADVLQIAQLYASGVDNVGLFSSYRFKNGEVREMKVGSTAKLPDPVPLEAPIRGTRSITLTMK